MKLSLYLSLLNSLLVEKGCPPALETLFFSFELLVTPSQIQVSSAQVIFPVASKNEVDFVP